MAEPMISLAAAADQVGMSQTTIRRAIATTGRHRLKAVKIRQQWRIQPSDLEAWIRSYTVQPVRTPKEKTA